MREDAARDRGPCPGATGHAPGENAHARELTDASGQRRICEQADAEGGEHRARRRVRRRQRLVDDDLPGDRADDDRDEVDRDRDGDPAPLDRAEGRADKAEVRPPPERERDDAGGDHGNERKADERVLEARKPVREPHATATDSRTAISDRSA